MHPGHGLFILGINGAVVDLAAIVRVGVEVIQAAECGAEVPQAGHIVGAEGDLIVGAVAVQVGGLDQMPVVLPVLQGHGAFDAQLFQPVGADDVGHIARDLLIQHGHIINIAVAVSQCFFDTVPLVDLLLQVGHVVLDVVVQGQDHAGLAVFQHLGGGHIHNDIRQLSIHHHKVQALVVVVLRGIIKFKIHIEFFAQDLPDIHLLGSNLVCGLGFQDAHSDALVGSSCSGTGSRRSSRGRAATALQDTQCQRSDHSAAYGASADFSFFHKIFSSLIYGMGRVSPRASITSAQLVRCRPVVFPYSEAYHVLFGIATFFDTKRTKDFLVFECDCCTISTKMLFFFLLSWCGMKYHAPSP